MKKRILSALMALCLLLTLLPTAALAAEPGPATDYVTVSNGGASSGSGEVVIEVVESATGNILGRSTITADTTNNTMTIALIENLRETYDIENVSFGGNWSSTLSSDSFTIRNWSLYAGQSNVFTVYLCPEFENPTIEGGWIDTDGVIRYRVTQAALLKLLHDNGVDVDANTKITNQQAVRAHFVNPYNGVSSEWPFDEKPAGGNVLQWYWIDEGLTDVSDLGNPYNIRYIEITYQHGDGEERTQKIYSGDLRYVNVGGNTYEIESNKNPDEHIVVFYQETSSDSMVWEPLDVRFIDYGESVGTLPEPPEYITDYDFVAWTQEYDGGLPVLETTYVKDDMNVFPQYTRTNLAQRIHVMNNDELLQDRLEELFADQLPAGDQIDWDTIKVTVHGTNGEQTNPDYYVSELDHNQWEDNYGHYLVYNYGGGVGQQENYSIPISAITKITVTADTKNGSRLDPVTIERGIYAGDFSVSTGAYEDSWLIELYINAENDYPENPDPGTDPDPAITGFDKNLVDSAAEATEAEITGIYNYPNTDGKVIIPEDGSVTLLYAITVTGKSGASFTVTDAGADKVAGNVTEDTTADTFTGSIPADATSITFYVSKQFTAEDLTGETGNQVLTNSASIESDDGVEDEDKETEEETPAEEAHDDLNGDDVTVQVYVDGTPVLNPLGYVTLSRVSSDEDYVGWYVSGPDASGMLTCDFDYESTADNGGYNCVDIKVDLTDDSTYILQGVRSYQSHGAHGTSNVINNNDGTYTIDNVTASFSDPDVVIYLYTKYSVEYYKGSSKLTEGSYTDTSAYIVEETSNLGNTATDGYPQSGRSAPMQWKNDTAYKTAIDLPVLPAAGADEVITGWFLGSVTGTQYSANTSYDVDETIIKSLSAGDRVIKFYAKATSTATADIDVKKELTSITRGESPLNGPFTDETILLENDVLTWTITVTNNGTQAVTGLKLSDMLTVNPDDGVMRTVTLMKGSESYTAGTEFTVPAAENGTPGKVTFTAMYTVQAADKGKTLSNSATVDDGNAGTTDPGDETTNPVGYTVTYYANGGSGNVASQVVAPGGTVTVSANGFTRNDYQFQNWNTQSDGGGTAYNPGNTLTVNSDINLYAQWSSTGGGSTTTRYYILHFESNGGTEFNDIRKSSSFTVDLDEYIPSRPGYRFTGWYRTRNLTSRVSGDFRVTGEVTIYAGWEETSVPSMLNGDDHYAYIQGYADGTVRPNANITRAQVATIFFRLLDADVREDYLTTSNTFPDVNEGYWANTAISTMAALGVINGRNSGYFDPNAYITRAEFAAICARFDDSDITGITTFADTTGHWAEEEIGRAAALGWIQGYSDGSFRPNQYITRAQAVTMINRVLCRLPEDEDDLLSDMNTWTDCREGDWYYLAIQEATNSHDFVTKDRVYESWTDLNADPNWSRYE